MNGCEIIGRLALCAAAVLWIGGAFAAAERSSDTSFLKESGSTYSRLHAGSVKLGTPFADGMVLQRDREVAVWGTAAAGERVKVSFADARVETVADDEFATAETIQCSRFVPHVASRVSR